MRIEVVNMAGKNTEYQPGGRRDFVVLERVLICRRYGVKACTEEEAVESFLKGEGVLMREKTIDRIIEEVSGKNPGGHEGPERLKGKGGLGGRCVICDGDDLLRHEKRFTGHGQMIRFLRCHKCGQEYQETWKAMKWAGIA